MSDHQRGPTKQARPEEEDPILTAIVDAELARFRHLVPPELLAAFRREGLALLYTHPTMRVLLEQLRERSPVKESGTLGPEDGEDAGADAVAGSGRRGGAA